VVCYCDTTIALPLLTAYALDRHPPRERRRLYDRREGLYDALRQAHGEARGEAKPDQVVEVHR
jgi:deoxyhypusine synthase